MLAEEDKNAEEKSPLDGRSWVALAPQEESSVSVGSATVHTCMLVRDTVCQATCLPVQHTHPRAWQGPSYREGGPVTRGCGPAWPSLAAGSHSRGPLGQGGCPAQDGPGPCPLVSAGPNPGQ